jgi:hypothetical protein
MDGSIPLLPAGATLISLSISLSWVISRLTLALALSLVLLDDTGFIDSLPPAFYSQFEIPPSLFQTPLLFKKIIIFFFFFFTQIFDK